MTPASEAEIELDARPDNVSIIRRATEAAAVTFGLDRMRTDDLVLAVGEASANVVMHAYEAGTGPLGLRLDIDEDALVAVVWDRGNGIAPRSDSPGLGLGLGVIAALSDSVEFRTATDGANEVCITFHGNGAGSPGQSGIGCPAGARPDRRDREPRR